MRSFEYFLVIIGAVMWSAAFYFGPETGWWSLGRFGLFALALAALLRVTEFLIPSSKPKSKTKKGPVRKCRVCGKPATTGSNFCSYHARYGSEDDRR